MRYISPNAISKNLTGENLAEAFDENGDAETDVCDIVVNGITRKLQRRGIKNTKKYSDLQCYYYVDLPLMSISNEDIKWVFHIFDELSKQPKNVCSQ